MVHVDTGVPQIRTAQNLVYDVTFTSEQRRRLCIVFKTSIRPELKNQTSFSLWCPCSRHLQTEDPESDVTAVIDSVLCISNTAPQQTPQSQSKFKVFAAI